MTSFYIPPRYKRPKVFIEEPRRLAVPIIISHYREEPVASGPRWPRRVKKESTKTQVYQNTICRWCQRRKAAKQLKALKEKEDREKRRIAKEKAQLELEKEYLRLLQEQYLEQERLRALYPPQPEPSGKVTPVFKKKEKTKTQVNRKPVSQWYKRQKSLRQYKSLQKKEEKERLRIAKEKKQLELEKEYLEKFTQQYHEQERLRAQYPATEPTTTRKNKKKDITNTNVNREPVSQWYKRQKALREFKSLQNNEEKERLRIAKEKAQLELEKEYLEKFTQQYHEQERLRAQFPLSEPTTTRKNKKKIIKEKRTKSAKTTYDKPRTVTKYVTVRRATNGSVSNRCQNWCYRLCCQFYCCLTFVLVMGFVIICIA